MVKHRFAFLLVVSLICATGAGRAFGKSQTKALAPEKVKAKIARIGIGEEARVEIRLADQTKVKGYIGGIEEEHFVVVISQTGLTTRVAYADVVKVKRPFSASNILGAVLTGVAAALLIVILVEYAAAKAH